MVFVSKALGFVSLEERYATGNKKHFQNITTPMRLTNHSLSQGTACHLADTVSIWTHPLEPIATLDNDIPDDRPNLQTEHINITVS